MLRSLFKIIGKANDLLLIKAILRMSCAPIAILFTSCAPIDIPEGPVKAPKPKATAVNQIGIDKNGCGPTALMNAYQFGSDEWNWGYKKLGRTTNSPDKEKFNDLVTRFGVHISRHDGLLRWDKRVGMSSLDLCDMANDLQKSRNSHLPKLHVNSHFNPIGVADHHLLQKVHKKLRNSMLKGFPPVMTVKRFAHRTFGKVKIWKQIHGHFVVLHEIPSKLEPQATSFPIKYIDPWGGRILSGTVKIPESQYYATDGTKSRNYKRFKTPALIIDFPNSNLGSHLIRKRERSVTILASSITP